MNRKQTLEILKETFRHFIIEENVQIDGIPVYLYFPTLKVLVVKDKLNMNSFFEVVVKEEENCVGEIINDILLGREFVPMFDAE